jgi:hypothetical protein
LRFQKFKNGSQGNVLRKGSAGGPNDHSTKRRANAGLDEMNQPYAVAANQPGQQPQQEDWNITHTGSDESKLQAKANSFCFGQLRHRREVIVFPRGNSFPTPAGYLWAIGHFSLKAYALK